ncbi:MAG: membrane protein insertion efficiency factor YidD [Kiritimatiellaeota bacterium]|nr:membrane protein insertion efficiency factor YidD [Kiritimatiellota bacterium]
MLTSAFPVLSLVLLYRMLISPWMPRCCRFTPSCSEYAETALRKHGLLRGTYLMVRRLLRCQPFCAGGHDPVPELKKRPLKDDDI